MKGRRAGDRSKKVGCGEGIGKGRESGRGEVILIYSVII
jgi:hypothetical protein